MSQIYFLGCNLVAKCQGYVSWGNILIENVTDMFLGLKVLLRENKKNTFCNSACVRDLLQFLFTSVDCAIRSQVHLYFFFAKLWLWHFSPGMTLWQTWCLACTMTTCQGGSSKKWKCFKWKSSNHDSKHINCKTLPFHISEADRSLYSPCWLLSLSSM